MHRFIYLILCLFFISACDSPMNHRVEGGNQPQKKLQATQLKSLALRVEIEWLTGPVGNINTDNQLMVILKNADGKPTSLPHGLSLNFYAVMPSMGHPMDDAGYFKELSEGIYLNPSIRYNMPGDWQNELWVMDSDFNVKDKLVWQEFF